MTEILRCCLCCCLLKVIPEPRNSQLARTVLAVDAPVGNCGGLPNPRIRAVPLWQTTEFHGRFLNALTRSFKRFLKHPEIDSVNVRSC